MGFDPGKGTAAGQVLTWDGSKYTWSAVSGGTSKPEGEWKRVVDRVVNRTVFADPVHTTTDQATDLAYYCSATGGGPIGIAVPEGSSFNRIALVKSNLSTGAISFLSSALFGVQYNTGNLTGTGWSNLTATFDSVVSTTPKMWFYVTGGPSGNQIVNFNEAASGLTVGTTITVGTSMSRPYFGPDGLLWVIAGGALRRFNLPFSASMSLDGTSYATGITHDATRNHFANDGTSMYVLDTNSTTSRIFRFTGTTLSSTTNSPAGTANMNCIAHDGRYLWVGKSDGGIYVFDTPNMTLAATIAAPTLQTQTLTNVNDLVFDGVYIVGIGTTSAGTKNVLFRIDPLTQRFVASLVGGATNTYRRLSVVPADRNGGNVYTIHDSGSNRQVQMIRDLADASVGALAIENGMLRRPRVLDGGTDTSPVTIALDKSVVLVKTDTYGAGLTLLLPALAGNGPVLTIKDIGGQAATKNITIDIAGGGGNVTTINTNFGFVTLFNTSEGGALWTRIG